LQEEDESIAKEPNPFVRRKTIQHTMHYGEEAERLAREEAEKRRVLDDQDREVQEKKKKREEAIQSSALLSDMHKLKRKKVTVDDEKKVLDGLHGSQLQLSRAHDFELDIDI
jgi:hypothetical protein